MESLKVNNQKRKKRKSRKSLNAIRNKALQNVIVDNVHKVCDDKTHNNKKKCIHKQSICITSKRLTLFNKVITSDPVSRSNISEIKNKIYRKDYKKGYVNIVAKLMSPLNRQITNEQLTTKYGNQKANVISCATQQCNSGAFRCKTQSSVISYSPSNKPEGSNLSKMFQLIDGEKSDMSSIDDSFSKYNFYNDFLNNIPNYLKKRAPMLLNTDFVHKCKISLRNLSVDKDYSDSWSGFTYKYSSEERLFQNPIDNVEYSDQEVLKPDSVSSPFDRIVCNSTMGLSSSPLSIVVSESPAYIYYPHKLNQ